MTCVAFLSKRFTPPYITIREQQRRHSAVCLIFIMYIIAILWGTLYLLFNPVAGIGPAVYLICSLLSFLLCYMFKWYYPLIHIHLGILILTPAIVHILHGNIHFASLVLIWSILPPIAGIFLFEKKRDMIVWPIIQIIVILSIFIFGESIHALVHPIMSPYKKTIHPIYYDINLFLNTFTPAMIFIFLLAMSRKRTYMIEDNIRYILYDIYPHHIANKIFENEHMATNTTEYNNANIIFIKFISNGTDTQQEIFSHIISNLFHAIDHQAEKHGVYKLKTISKIYLAGTELFETTTIDNLISFAFSIKKIVNSINRFHKTNITYTIGINSGNIVASLIGKQKIMYDVWGDTVNVASRLSNTKYTNEIILSQTSFDKAQHIYQSTPHTLYNVKGKGMLKVYSIQEHT